MTHDRRIDRRAVGRALSRILDASVTDVLASLDDVAGATSHRIGFTGPPGAGKSTLISGFARATLAQDRTLGVLAIDPTSPISRGSILGDRIRMDAVSDDPRLFIRSLPSRGGLDGLCDDAGDLLLTMEAQGFDTVALETVGVGQSEVMVRHLVDTMVLVLPPGAGDSVQAMKAGILEVADVYVISKGDMPEAEATRADIAAMAARRAKALPSDAWRPPVVITTSRGEGIDALLDATQRHRAWLNDHRDEDAIRRARRRQHLLSLVVRHADHALATDEAPLTMPLRAAYGRLIGRLSADAPPPDDGPAEA